MYLGPTLGCPRDFQVLDDTGGLGRGLERMSFQELRQDMALPSEQVEVRRGDGTSQPRGSGVPAGTGARR
jgi:hypothetical protein